MVADARDQVRSQVIVSGFPSAGSMENAALDDGDPGDAGNGADQKADGIEFLNMLEDPDDED